MSWLETPVYKIKTSGVPETGESLSDEPDKEVYGEKEQPITPAYNIPYSPEVDTTET